MNRLNDFIYKLRNNELNDLEAGLFAVVLGLIMFWLSYWIYNSYKKEGYTFKTQKRDSFMEYFMDTNRVRTYLGSFFGMIISMIVIISGILHLIKHFTGWHPWLE